MKSYFKFNLTGKKVFPIWLILLVLFIIPYTYIQLRVQGLINLGIESPEVASNTSRLLPVLYSIMFFLLFIEYSVMFFIAKLTIQAVEYKEKSLEFNGKFREYLLLLVIGFVLSIITLGIYTPWFYAKMNKFFAKNTSYESNSIEFKGKGTDLFLIILVSIVIPLVLLFAFLLFVAFTTGMVRNFIPGQIPNISIAMAFAISITFIVISLLFFPFTYYFYKWLVNYKYKNYEIKMETTFWSSVGKIFLETILSMITFGIYLPLAILKLYKYFTDRTIVKSNNNIKKFGFEIEIVDDFLIIWGQILLCIVTLGFYYPWAYCKISERFINKTFVEEIQL